MLKVKVMSNTKRFDKEILSAWVDGKADLQDQEPSLEQGSESMAVWTRYHMIGQVMRDEAQHMDLDISASVSKAIAEEDSHEASQKAPKDNVIPFPNRVWKQAGGFAIAASVAIVALFNVSNTQPGTVNSAQTNFAATADSADTTNATVASTNLANTAVASTADRQELQTMHDMFLKHEALTRKITGASGLPTVRVVSNQKVIPVQVPMRVKEDSEQSAKEATKQ
ncbi:anti-sigma 24 factor [Kangiella sp. HD9-110m-PIT-SAG07]|nr:anti-sigma 24 factor [Kangiella sp. HD9-110m-PIT-SAG07]